MITGAMLIHWIGVVIVFSSLIFLFLGFVASALLVQWIRYTAWRSPSATMREKIGWSVTAIFSLLLEVAFIYACLTGIRADGSPALLPQSDDTYWAIFLLAFGCHTLMLLYLVRRLDANTVKSVVREALAQRRERRVLKRKSND